MAEKIRWQIHATIQDDLPPQHPLLFHIGVTIFNRLLVNQHVHNVMSCAQTMHALRTSRNHGVMNTTLQILFKSVVVTKLTYDASAWSVASPV